jgi:hypothetical protein
LSGAPRGRARQRRRWRNHTGNQAVDPLRIYRPGEGVDDETERLAEVAGIVREAEREGVTVRAVGSGHSWSDAALTRGFMLDPGGLARPLELETEVLREGAGARSLVRVESGIRIRELNQHLEGLGLALPNMGGYDGQTIAGVVSTSTHGSGIGFGPLNDLVRSLDLVVAGGRVVRIEPEPGLTDPEAFAARYPDRDLRQSDEAFNAAVVGFGCMGVICSLILEVRDAFYLKERRWLSSWSEVKEQLAPGADGGLPAILAEHDHYEVYVNPHGNESGDNDCLITTRDEVGGPAPERSGRHRSRRNLLAELGSRLWFITPHVLNFVIDRWPRTTPWLLTKALEGLADDEYTDRSYRVLNIGAANLLPAYSAEIALPLDGRHVEAMDAVIEIAAARARIGNVFNTAPVSLRFVRASEAHLSMMQGRDTMMMELIEMTRTEGGYEALAAYEEALDRCGGRPHWGQVNTLTGGLAKLRRLYAQLDSWLVVHDELNSSGVFDGPMSARVGIARGPGRRPRPGMADRADLEH